MDQQQVERMVGNIMWRARAELTRRRGMTPVEAVAGWFRPAFAAAAAVAAISLTAIATTNQQTGSEETVATAGAYMPSTEVPAALASWYEEGSSPTADELLVANGGE